MHSIICKNCEHSFKGNFCPHCGQSAKVEHIGLGYFLHDIPHSVLHIDKGFFYTLGKLFINPGTALKDYLDGKRVKHFRPFAFVLIMSTISTIIIKLCQYAINIRFQKDNAGKIISSDNVFEHYPSLLIFLLIPLLSIVTWLCFKKRKYNYWEHFLVNTYLAAYLNVFLVIINIFRLGKYYVNGSLSVNFTMFMIIFMTYYGYAFGRLMAGSGSIKKNVLTILLMNFLLATIYMTAFSITALMDPWWGK